MGLPNPLSKVNWGFEKRQSMAERISKVSSTKDSITKDIAGLSSNCDALVLAYLWFAIESDYNILIFANSGANAEGFIESLNSFVPLYKSVIDTRYDGKVLDQRINFLNLICPKGTSIKEQIGFIERQMPDRLITRNMAEHLDKVFALSTQGISFTSLIHGNFAGSSVIRMLSSSHFRIKKSSLHMLDLSVFLEGDGKNYRISAITEYKWLSRGEMVVNSNALPKRYHNIRICNSNVANIEGILKSKLIKNYSESNLISKKEAFKELKSRAKFLEELGRSGFKSRQNNPIEMYYEIK